MVLGVGRHIKDCHDCHEPLRGPHYIESIPLIILWGQSGGNLNSKGSPRKGSNSSFKAERHKKH